MLPDFPEFIRTRGCFDVLRNSSCLGTYTLVATLSSGIGQGAHYLRCCTERLRGFVLGPG